MQKTMQKVDWSIVDWNTEHNMFTYSEEEKQQNEINKASNNAVRSPKFIAINPMLLDHLSITEAYIYGFIDFYVCNWTGRFYFTNEQLASLARCSINTVSTAIKNIEKLWLIKTSRKMRAGGWQIRFISSPKNSMSVSQNLGDATTKNSTVIKNKINNNKIKESNVILLKRFVDKRNDIDKLFIGNRKIRWLMKVNTITPGIEREWHKLLKELTKDQIVTSISNYIDHIKKINKEGKGWYADHRFSFYKFIKQDNWAREFINYK